MEIAGLSATPSKNYCDAGAAMWSGVHLEVAAGSLLDFGMYTVIKIVRGRRYLYEQRTWREGKRVRTESHYLGP